MVFLFAGVALCGLFVRQKRLVEPLLILGLAYASLTSVRHSTVFVVMVAPIIAAELSVYWQAWVVQAAAQFRRPGSRHAFHRETAGVLQK